MHNILRIIAILCIPILLNSQQEIAEYIFIGHPRSGKKTPYRAIKKIEKIDFSKFELTLLGGDLTWNTSSDFKTLDYCEQVFKLSSPSTHLAIGNHDRNNVSQLLRYTKKPRFYSFTKNKITFLVLDTEISTPDIKGNQLKLIKAVCDTIEKSKFLILLQHRIFWMIGRPEFSHFKDCIGLSTNKFEKSNFYSEVYPLLKKVQDKGIQVICIAGDRTDYPIEYTSSDGIQFLASGLKTAYPHRYNYTIVFTHNLKNGILEWDFVPINKLPKF